MDSNEYSSLIPSNHNNSIVFAVVDPGADVKYYEDGITHYPSEESLRVDRLGNKNIIWLTELAKSNCKKCNGTGKVGNLVVEFPLNKIEAILSNNLEKTPEKIPLEIIRLIQLSESLIEPLTLLVDIAKDDLQPDNLEAIVVRYAKIIQEDYKMKGVQWCKCFLDNYKEEVNNIIRNIKYGVN